MTTKVKSPDQFRGLVLTAYVREHLFLNIGGTPRLVKGKWYAQIALPDEFKTERGNRVSINVIDQSSRKPTEDEVTMAVKKRFPTVRKVEFNYL